MSAKPPLLDPEAVWVTLNAGQQLRIGVAATVARLRHELGRGVPGDLAAKWASEQSLDMLCLKSVAWIPELPVLIWPLLEFALAEAAGARMTTPARGAVAGSGTSSAAPVSKPMLSHHAAPPQASPTSFVRGPFSDHERDLVQRRAAQGWKCGRISQVLNRHPASTRYVMLVLGCYRAKASRRPAEGQTKTLKPFTADEDLFISTCRVAGHTLSVIARAATARFGNKRTTGAVRMRLLLLASKEENHDE